MRSSLAFLFSLTVSMASEGARAEERAAAPTSEAEGGSDGVSTHEHGGAPRTRAPLAAVVRGLFIETRVGGGYAVVDADVPADPAFPELDGSEGLGSSMLMGMSLGYDVNESFAVEVLAGASLVSGTRRDRVRDLALFYGGVGLRGAFSVSERTSVTLGAGGGFVRADNAVEAVESGPALLGTFGVEYFAHVRHFSVGLDANVLAALAPSRVIVGLTPKLKYTF